MENNLTAVGMSGKLYLVGTPIGNLGDISARALEILHKADLIAAEDTRVTALLLSHFNIKTRLVSYHEHNAQSRGQQLLEHLRAGRTIALVSDAGMPCISDPGEDIVRLCVQNNIDISVVPGPSAALAALAASGLMTQSFVFEGFLPVENKLRRIRLEKLSAQTRTIILYEAPHRLQKTLDDLVRSGLGDRRIVLSRELTKKYEQWLRMTVDQAVSYHQDNKPRGEYVLVLEGGNEYEGRCPADPKQIEQRALLMMQELLDQGLSVGQAAKKLAAEGIMKKNDLYRIGLTLQSSTDSL